MEVDSSLVNQPQQLQERIARLFRLAKVSVDRELRIQGSGASQYADANRTTSDQDASPRPATANQIRAIHAIANRHQIDLVAELRSRFDVNRPDDLTLGEASELIDFLKPATNGPVSE
jgi:hypothetical protein